MAKEQNVEQKSPPFPSPREDEDRQEFASRCIEEVENEDTDMTHKQIQGACFDRYDEAQEEKEASMEDKLDDVHDAWYNAEAVAPLEPEPDVAPPGRGQLLKVFEDHVIVHLEGKYYRYPYTRSEEGDIEFGEPVELEFTPVDNANESETEEKAKWSTAYVNDLKNSAFLFIESGGENDDEGKTKPRSLRHLPYKNKSGNVDLSHLRNAISRLGQDDTGKNWEGFTEDKKKSLQKKAQGILERETEEKDFNFELRELTWPEVDVKGHKIAIKARDDVVWSVFLDENPLEAKGLPITGRDPLVEKTKTEVYVLDKGSCIIGNAEDTKREYELKGEHLDGKFTFHKDAEGLWTMTRPANIRGLWRNIVELFKKEQRGPIVVTKDAKTERPRWTMISSTAFYDRESQIVTRKGVDKSISRADAAGGARGDLTFWHTDVKLGECDFQARHGLCLIESGLFDDTPVGRRAAETLSGPVGKSWGGSIEFLPLETPAKNVLMKGKLVDAIWDDFQIVRRSALPGNSAAAKNTGVYVYKKEAEMDARKKDALVKLLGPDVAATVLEGAESVNEKAESPGAIYKDVSIVDRLDLISKEVDDEEVQETLEELSEKESLDEDVETLKEIAGSLDGLAAIAMKGVVDELTSEPESEEEPEEEDETALALKELREQFAKLQKELKEVKEAPRGAIDQHRASEDPDNVLKEKDNGENLDDQVAAVVEEIAASGFGLQR